MTVIVATRHRFWIVYINTPGRFVRLSWFDYPTSTWVAAKDCSIDGYLGFLPECILQEFLATLFREGGLFSDYNTFLSGNIQTGRSQ